MVIRNIRYYFLLFGLSLSLNFTSQTTVYVATARLNKSTINYAKQISSDIEFVDFMQVKFEERDNLLKKCSGLILLGGLDIHPSRYNKEELEKYCEVDQNRDSIELALLRWADTSSLPIFGICRGMQFINVYFGGTLCVDIPTFCKPSLKNEKHRDPKRKKDVYHKVTFSENSKLFACFGSAKSVTVNSFHHQCVDELGKTLKITAKSSGGITEAIENDENHRKSFILGVQWHPERYYEKDPNNLKIFQRFFNEIKLKN